MRRDFDIDSFLSDPLVGRVATSGPKTRPVWFLWEDQAFWWLTGFWSSLEQHLQLHSSVALVVDTCDLKTGEVKQVRARGAAEVRPYDRERAYRKLSRYLGLDDTQWDHSRFEIEDDLAPTKSKFVRMAPERLEALDLSYVPATPL